MNASLTNSEKRCRSRRSWLLAAIALGLVAAGAATTVFLLNPPAEVLAYGRFRRQLVDGKIASARVGATSIEGQLAQRDDRGRPMRYWVSKVGMEHDEDLIRLLDSHISGGDYEAEAGPSRFQTAVLPVVLVAVLFGTFAWLLTRSGGVGSVMAFTRSRPRVYDGGEERITFDDVAGNEEVVAELKEVVEFLRSPDKFRSLGGRIPKGVLLIGPPGTGKTLLARAVAGEASVPFYSLCGSDFVELFVGVGAARVRSLFARAAAKAPCLIFIDELDAIGKARGAGGPGGHDERDQTLNQLLVELDGFDSNRGIILLAATNRPEILDPALVRPGRFDRQVVVDRPDLLSREQILKVHTRAVPLDGAINLRQVAGMTSGFVGADLANLVNEAALLAARREKSLVGLSELEEGIERLIAGPEKRQRLLRTDEKFRIAYHEAGHALVARCLPMTDPVRKVSIVGRGNGALGYTLYRPEEDRFLHTRTALANAISGLLGGTLAEEIALGEISDGCVSDLRRVTQIARRMVMEFGMSAGLGRLNYGGESDATAPGREEQRWSEQTSREVELEIRKIVEQAEQRAREILESHRSCLDRIVACLLEQETIDHEDLDRIMAATTCTPPPDGPSLPA